MQERHELEVTESVVDTFAELSGDTNPIHLDEEYASETLFGERIAHGMIAASAVSAALAKFNGTIVYLEQDLSFEAPVTLGTTITATVQEQNRDGEMVTLDTTVVDDTGTTVVEGEATILQKED